MIRFRRRRPVPAPFRPDPPGWTRFFYDSNHPEWGAVEPVSGHHWDKVLFRHRSGWEYQVDGNDPSLLDPDFMHRIEQIRVLRVRAAAERERNGVAANEPNA